MKLFNRRLFPSCVLLAAVCSTGLSGCAHQGSKLQVHIEAQHQDADLLVDGQYVGVLSELTQRDAGLVQLAPGQHRVEVRKPGFFPYQRAVQVPRRQAPEFIEFRAQLYEDPN